MATQKPKLVQAKTKKKPQKMPALSNLKMTKEKVYQDRKHWYNNCFIPGKPQKKQWSSPIHTHSKWRGNLDFNSHKVINKAPNATLRVSEISVTEEKNWDSHPCQMVKTSLPHHGVSRDSVWSKNSHLQQ